MFIGALFIAAKGWRQPIYLSNNEWINEMWYIHTMEHYFAVKRMKILIQATTWMDLENTELSEKSQSQTTYYMIMFMLNAQNREIYKDRK